MTDNFDMDVDQEMFDEFSLGDEDLLVLEQEEQFYLSQQLPSSQQISSSQSHSMQTSQSTQQTERVEPITSVEENITRSSRTDSYRDPVETINEPEEEPSAPVEHETSTGYGPEADRIIEGLRFQLQRLEVSSAPYNVQNSSKELLGLKEMLKEKELQVIQLKKDLYKYREREADQGKRTFPGVNVHEKPKHKKSSRPSPFSQVSQTFSSARSRSSTPSLSSQQSQRPSLSSQQSQRPHLQSQLSSQLQSQPQSEPPAKLKRSEPIAPMFVKLQSAPKLAQLASQQSPLPPPPPGIIPNRQPQAKVKKEPIIQHINLEPNKRPSPKKPKIKKGPKTKHTATESNNKLLKVLFTPAFQKWNITTNHNSKDINMVLNRQPIKQFSDDFSKQFIPEQDQCSSVQIYNHLKLLASDIYSYISKSEHADATIRLLLNVLNLCLSICIKEKIFNTIQNIATVINLLSSHFPVAARYLYKDLKFDENSLLTQFANALVLYPFTDPEPLQILSEKPDIESKPLGEINRDTVIYTTTPSQISQAIHTVKTPKEAVVTVTCILELFYHIGCKETAFQFLMYHDNFLNLLYQDRPYGIIISALNVLETNFKDLNCMDSYDDNKNRVIIRLTSLLTCSKDKLSLKDWYKLRRKCMGILNHVIRTKLPASKLISIQKEIFINTNELLEKESVTLNKIQAKETIEIRKESGRLLEIGMKTMYHIITQCPEDIFTYINPLAANSFFNLVYYFQKGVSRNHPANEILSQLDKLLLKYLTEHRPPM